MWLTHALGMSTVAFIVAHFVRSVAYCTALAAGISAIIGLLVSYLPNDYSLLWWEFLFSPLTELTTSFSAEVLLRTMVAWYVPIPFAMAAAHSRRLLGLPFQQFSLRSIMILFVLLSLILLAIKS
jgi:hypothetical protein